MFNRIFNNFSKTYGILGVYTVGRKIDFECYRYLITKLESEYGMIND